MAHPSKNYTQCSSDFNYDHPCVYICIYYSPFHFGWRSNFNFQDRNPIPQEFYWINNFLYTIIHSYTLTHEPPPPHIVVSLVGAHCVVTWYTFINSYDVYTQESCTRVAASSETMEIQNEYYFRSCRGWFFFHTRNPPPR